MLRPSLMPALLMLCSCSKVAQLPIEPPREERYRPSWTATIAVHVDGVRACLDGRETPCYVAHIEPLASGAVGITTVDAYGSIQHCAYSDGKVLRREQADLAMGDLTGLPLFSSGSATPVTPVGVVLEEVLHDELVLGWLYWPPSSDPSRSGSASADVTHDGTESTSH